MNWLDSNAIFDGTSKPLEERIRRGEITEITDEFSEIVTTKKSDTKMPDNHLKRTKGILPHE